jgi:hypothetical protein
MRKELKQLHARLEALERGRGDAAAAAA